MALPTLEEIGKVVERLRAEAGISQERLGALTGLHQRTVSFMERGQSITVENLWKVLEHFGRGLDALSNEPSRNAPEGARARPEPDSGQIPLADHRAALRALRLEIEALQRELAASPAPGTLSREQIADLGELAARNAKRLPPEPPEAGSVSSGSRRSPRTKGKS